MKRIAVVGISGSGKSTLANNIGKKLGIPVYHLDKYFWDNNWKQRYSKPEFKKLVEGFYENEEWVIDGNYRSANIDLRFEKADTIIWLNFPKWRGVWRAFSRIFKKGQPFDKTEGIKERIDWELIMWIVKYNTRELRERLDRFRPGRNIIILRSNKEINKFVESLI